ncbi:hypothetical protein FGIG_00708 [Fasciola gigantica]|uniref:Uncharacterized protein n=1 Tax=Fasciola gigantica TaxID=46835 RepID=A0A504YK17_FASGI|nr:hypothetical protein FGIG_00708 [Fasciola gigantica]
MRPLTTVLPSLGSLFSFPFFVFLEWPAIPSHRTRNACTCFYKTKLSIATIDRVKCATYNRNHWRSRDVHPHSCVFAYAINSHTHHVRALKYAPLLSCPTELHWFSLVLLRSPVVVTSSNFRQHTQINKRTHFCFCVHPTSHLHPYDTVFSPSVVIPVICIVFFMCVCVSILVLLSCYAYSYNCNLFIVPNLSHSVSGIVS